MAGWLRGAASLVLLCCCCIVGCAGWVQLSPSDGSITARRGHTAITVADRFLVVFGGRSVYVTVLTDTSATSSSVSACWSTGGCHEEAAAGTCNSACAANNTAACVCTCTTGFSGANCQVETVDVWLSSVSVWDMWNAGWLTVDSDPAGTVNPVAWPAARYQHSAALLGDYQMIVYGGYSQLCGDFCSDLWRYGMETLDSTGRGQWTEVAPADTSNYPGKLATQHGTAQHSTTQATYDVRRALASLPSSVVWWCAPFRRWQHATAVYGGLLWLWGGHRHGQYLNDMWQYEPSSSHIHTPHHSPHATARTAPHTQRG